jgi:hypothetical protein
MSFLNADLLWHCEPRAPTAHCWYISWKGEAFIPVLQANWIIFFQSFVWLLSKIWLMILIRLMSKIWVEGTLNKSNLWVIPQQLDQGSDTFHQPVAQQLLEYQASTRQIKFNTVSVSSQQPQNLCSIILDLNILSLVNFPIYCSRSSTLLKWYMAI